MKLPRRHSQRGFTLLEVLLAIGISLALGAAALTDLRRDNESKQAMAVGQQLETVGKAVNTYLALHYSQIVALANVAGAGSSADPGPRTCTADAGTSPFGGGTSSICTITTDTLVRSGLLPVSFSGRNAFGAQYNIYIRVTGTATPIVDGMVITDTPYTTGPGGVRFDLLGQAMQVAGADSGMTRTTATVLEGLNGTWRDEAWPAVQGLPGLNARGLLGYRSGYGSSGYASYLRLDGTTPMTGDLQMGNNDILDVDNFVGRRAQLKGNADGSDTEILTLRADPANANSVDRTAFVAGAGSVSVRNQNGVSFQNLAGNAGARVSTGDLTATGNLNVEGSAGNNGDITASRNMVVGQDLTVNRRVSVGNGLTVAGGAAISGNSSVDGNLTIGGTNTMTAYNVVAINAVNAGGYTVSGSGLSSGGPNWFYDNSVAAWRTTAGVQVDGNTRTRTLGVDTTATVGTSLQLTGSGGVVLAGESCLQTEAGTFRRASNEIVQCVPMGTGWYWRSGLNIETRSANFTTIAFTSQPFRVACPQGSRVVSGGYSAARGTPQAPVNGVDTDQPSASQPYFNADNSSGWMVQSSQTNAQGTVYTVTAVCAK